MEAFENKRIHERSDFSLSCFNQSHFQRLWREANFVQVTSDPAFGRNKDRRSRMVIAIMFRVECIVEANRFCDFLNVRF